jgi:MtN3 and saliva related transmembrane protein
MGNLDWIDLLGLSAAALTTGAFLPQAVKVLRTRHTRDLSLAMYLVMSIGNLVWLIYGIALLSRPLILANAITLSLTMTILVLKLRHG